MIATIAAYIAITENMLIQKLGLTLCCLFFMCSAAHQLTPCPKDTPSPVISSTFESTVILTADVGSGNERMGVGFWARSTKEQAFMIKVYYPHGDQRMMLLGIYSATIPMVYTMNTTNGVSICYGTPLARGSKLPTFDWLNDAACFEQFIKEDCDTIEIRQNPNRFDQFVEVKKSSHNVPYRFTTAASGTIVKYDLVSYNPIEPNITSFKVPDECLDNLILF